MFYGHYFLNFQDFYEVLKPCPEFSTKEKFDLTVLKTMLKIKLQHPKDPNLNPINYLKKKAFLSPINRPTGFGRDCYTLLSLNHKVIKSQTSYALPNSLNGRNYNKVTENKVMPHKEDILKSRLF